MRVSTLFHDGNFFPNLVLHGMNPVDYREVVRLRKGFPKRLVFPVLSGVGGVARYYFHSLNGTNFEKYPSRW